MRRLLTIIAAFGFVAVSALWISSYWLMLVAVYDRVDAKTDQLKTARFTITSVAGGVLLMYDGGTRYEPIATAQADAASHRQWHPHSLSLNSVRADDAARNYRYSSWSDPHPLGFQFGQRVHQATPAKPYYYRTLAASVPYWFIYACSAGVLAIRFRHITRNRHSKGFDPITNPPEEPLDQQAFRT